MTKLVLSLIALAVFILIPMRWAYEGGTDYVVWAAILGVAGTIAIFNEYRSPAADKPREPVSTFAMGYMWLPVVGSIVLILLVLFDDSSTDELTLGIAAFFAGVLVFSVGLAVYTTWLWRRDLPRRVERE